MKKTHYYTNLLDSVLFQNKYSGHGKTNIAVRTFYENDSYKDIVKALKEQYKLTEKHKKESNSSKASLNELSSNDYYEEFSCAHILPTLLQIYERLNKKDAALVLSLNQVADNHAVISDLGIDSGFEDVVSIFCKFFKIDKFIISTYPNKLNNGDHSILSYIYYNLISALYRINSSTSNRDDVGFISSLFHNLGGTSFEKQSQKSKNAFLLSELYQYDDVKKLLECCYYDDVKKFSDDFCYDKVKKLLEGFCDDYVNKLLKKYYAENKKEEYIILIFDKIFEKYLTEKKGNLNLGYITTIKYILMNKEFPTAEQQANSFAYFSTFLSETEKDNYKEVLTTKRKYFEKNEEERNEFRKKDEQNPTYFDIIYSLTKLEDAAKDKYVDNIPDIFSLTYESKDSDILSIYESDTQIFTKTLKAFLNNKELFMERIDMLIYVLKKNSFSDKECEIMKEAIYNYLKNMASTINGARSKFITPMIEIKNERKTYTKKTEFKDQLIQLIEDDKSKDIIKRFLDSEENNITKCRKNDKEINENRKEDKKTPTNSVKTTSITSICNVILELLIYVYNACYARLTADGRMFEADGTLKFSHNQYVMDITEIHERVYEIENGKLIYKEKGRIL